MKFNRWIIYLLTKFRDMRIVWDLMGFLYNRCIYDLIADLYEYIASELIINNNEQILDVGTGQGYLTLLLAHRNPHASIIGIDYSLMQVTRAEKYRRKNNIYNCSFLQKNVLSLDFKTSTFDAIVSVGSIKHWSNIHRGLAAIHRVLKPGHCLILAETDREISDDDLQKFAKGFRVPLIPEGLLFWGLRNVVFGQSFSYEELVDIIGKAGFRNVENVKVTACPYVIVKAWK